MVLSPVVDLHHVMTAMRKSAGVMVRIFLHASNTSCVEIPTQSVHAVTLLVHAYAERKISVIYVWYIACMCMRKLYFMVGSDMHW